MFKTHSYIKDLLKPVNFYIKMAPSYNFIYTFAT